MFDFLLPQDLFHMLRIWQQLQITPVYQVIVGVIG